MPPPSEYPAPGAPPPGPPQPYPGDYAAMPPVNVRRRTFFLTLAQVIMIVRAVLIMLAAVAVIGLGVFVAVAGRAELSKLPGYEDALRQYGTAIADAAALFLIITGAVLLVIGVADLLLGIFVGRPSNAVRWIIVVLDVLTAIGLLSRLATHLGAGGALTLVVLLALKAVVFYALVLDPATRRCFDQLAVAPYYRRA